MRPAGSGCTRPVWRCWTDAERRVPGSEMKTRSKPFSSNTDAIQSTASGSPSAPGPDHRPAGTGQSAGGRDGGSDVLVGDVAEQSTQEHQVGRDQTGIGRRYGAASPVTTSTEDSPVSAIRSRATAVLRGSSSTSRAVTSPPREVRREQRE